MNPTFRGTNSLSASADINWIPIVLLSLSVAFSLFGDMAMYAIVPTYYVELGLSPFQVGLVLSVNRWVRLLTNPLAGNVLNQKNQKLFLSAALILGAALSALYATRPPFVVLLLARLAWGLCWSFIRHAGVMSSLSMGPGKSAGRIIGAFHGLVQIGFIAGAFSGGYLFDLLGFSKAFVIMGLISIISIPFELAGIKRHRDTGSRTINRSESPPTGHVGLYLIIKGFVVACVGSGLIMSTLGYVLRSELGNAVQIGSLIIGISTINGFMLAVRNIILSLGALFAGIALDKTKKGLVESISFTSAVIALGAVILLLKSAYIVPLIIVFFIASTMSRIALISRAGVRGSKAYAKFVSASDLGAAVGPLLGWIGIDAARDPKTILLGGLILYALAMFLPVTSRSCTRHQGKI